jgi:hypothetical protein
MGEENVIFCFYFWLKQIHRRDQPKKRQPKGENCAGSLRGAREREGKSFLAEKLASPPFAIDLLASPTM